MTPFAALLLLVQQQPADLVVLNARVYTADANRPVAEALAVRGGRIAFVGSARGAAIDPFIRIAAAWIRTFDQSFPQRTRRVGEGSARAVVGQRRRLAIGAFHASSQSKGRASCAGR